MGIAIKHANLRLWVSAGKALPVKQKEYIAL